MVSDIHASEFIDRKDLATLSDSLLFENNRSSRHLLANQIGNSQQQRPQKEETEESNYAIKTIFEKHKQLIQFTKFIQSLIEQIDNTKQRA